MCVDNDCHDPNGRRRFIAGTTLALAGLASGGAAQPPPTRVLDDPAVSHGRVEFAGVGGYLARPRVPGRVPAVLVVAGNVITEEYIPNTCAALALGGFVGLAPDIYHALPVDGSREQVNAFLAAHTDRNYLADIRAGADYLRGHASVAAGPMGILGFCSGGRRALLYAAAFDGIGAVVAYHTASMTTTSEVAAVRAPTQLHHGTGDKVSPHEVSLAIAKHLRDLGRTVEAHLYEGADHGFLAYTREPEYDPAAAQLSWQRTIAFLARHLKG